MAPVGAMVPATGRYAVQGAQVRAGLELWARRTGAGLVVEDDGSRPERAARLHAELVGRGCRFVLGPYGSDSTRAVATASPGTVVWNHGAAADDVQRLPGVVSLPSPASRYLVALEDLARSVDLPDWAFSVITGGPKVGQRLTSSSHVDGLCFTGGVGTGTKVASAGGAGLKRIVLELGGRTPFVVLADADISAAAELAALAAFGFQGQACNAGSLLMAEECIYSDFVAALAGRVEGLTVGHQLSPETELGPMISESQRDRVERLVKDARAAGAGLVCGGRRVPRPGFFYQPTLLTDVPSGHPAIREEIFGPAAVCCSFGSEAEVVRRINQSPFGLAATICSGDDARAEALARRLRTGVVYVNAHGAVARNAPWGGFRASGLGRLYGTDGLYAFTEARQIYAAAAPA